MLHQSTTVVCWLLDGVRMITNISKLHTPKLCHYKLTTSKLFGHAATYKGTTLPSCDLCYKSRMRHCQTGQPLCQCNNCTGGDIYDHPKASMYCELFIALIYNYTDVQCIRLSMNNILCLIKHHLNGYQILYNLQKWRWDLVIDPKVNAMHFYILLDWINQSARLCANIDIKCPIPQSWKTSVSLDIFIEAPMHLLFLGIVNAS